MKTLILSSLALLLLASCATKQEETITPVVVPTTDYSGAVRVDEISQIPDRPIAEKVGTTTTNTGIYRTPK